MLRVITSFAKLNVNAAFAVRRSFGCTAVVDKTAAKPKRTASASAAPSKGRKAAAKKAAKPKAKAKKPAKKPLSPEETILEVPKAPAGSYLLFHMEKAKDSEFSSVGSITEMSRSTALKWKLLSEDEKQKYFDQAKALRTEYEKMLVKWWRDVDLRLLDLENKRRRRINRRVKAEGKGNKLGLLKDPLAPKRPTSAFFHYLVGRMGDAEGNDLASRQKLSKQAASDWKGLSNAQKAPFVKAQQESQHAYEKALAEYKQHHNVL
ncbi:hypothetical protein GGI25_006447 [Coemansia spiralis]|uniref:HMG box domain-containing protein n=2 Tax=Coemansia TaxID=4863 RepID=A0A9W8FWW3_9FUNG|nr:hypothetical protein EDC05_004750 [Coemansia umbellata]KAJ2668432.1 hypothetical protein GGI25_006447 [Coemansia spiralis]